MDADEREAAVESEEQHDDDEDDAGSAVSSSVEHSGPPVGLYLNSMSVLSTFICPVLSRMRSFAQKLSHDIGLPSPQSMRPEAGPKCPTTLATIGLHNVSRVDKNDRADVSCGPKTIDVSCGKNLAAGVTGRLAT